MPAGAPTKYRKEYCKQLIDYIENWEPYYESPVEKQDKDGNVTTKMVKSANPPPSLVKFAQNIGVARDSLYEWGEVHKEFSDALKKAKDAMEESLVENGLNGSYNNAMAIFALKNRCHWTDKQEITGRDGKDLYPKMSDEDIDRRLKELTEK